MTPQSHQHSFTTLAEKFGVDLQKKDKAFAERFYNKLNDLTDLFHLLYEHHSQRDAQWENLIETIVRNYKERTLALKKEDQQKAKKDKWFLSQSITGMSLYVDRFCGHLSNMPEKLEYLKDLGISLIHLMPIFESPENESDGGYAVSDFRKVDKRYGKLSDLKKLIKEMKLNNMQLMLDIVLNHTSHHHTWAKEARNQHPVYKDYYYMFDDRHMPDIFDREMPDIFPESAPGNFTYVPECDKWVMSVFHNYQWDLNFRNPAVLVDMLDNIYFYANLGVDVLRIDAPAFIWKQEGTKCQNLPNAHRILALIKLCVEISTPGMALLGEAIVAPKEIMKYFGTGHYYGRECDFAYQATHMALQWDMLATGDVRVMLAAQHELLQKPYGTSWITYTRCHDDIGLGYDDEMIRHAGFDPYQHRKFLQDFYSGNHPYSTATGALFSSNPKTGDARISGSLASLCGLEKAINEKNDTGIQTAINKILLMQAHSFFLGGVPMIFFGDEVGYTNNYDYLQDPGKSYDNRWMHRPVIDWKKNALAYKKKTTEQQIFSGTKKLIEIRNQFDVFADQNNLVWLTPHNIHVAGYLRHSAKSNFFCVFNFSNEECNLTWYAFKEKHLNPSILLDHWTGKKHKVGHDNEYLTIAPYQFYLFEVVE